MGYNVSSWGVINQRTQVGGAHLDFSKESLGFMCETLNKATNQRSMNMCPKAEEINTTTFSKNVSIAVSLEIQKPSSMRGMRLLSWLSLLGLW